MGGRSPISVGSSLIPNGRLEERLPAFVRCPSAGGQDLQVSPASRRNSVLFSKRSTRLVAGALMKAKCFLLMTTLLISGCTQVNDQFYSKKNFTGESFRADASECKRQNPSSPPCLIVLFRRF